MVVPLGVSFYAKCCCYYYNYQSPCPYALRPRLPAPMRSNTEPSTSSQPTIKQSRQKDHFAKIHKYYKPPVNSHYHVSMDSRKYFAINTRTILKNKLYQNNQANVPEMTRHFTARSNAPSQLRQNVVANDRRLLIAK